jgi:glycerophosphoryl diester phosphodiesterase
MVNKSYKRQIVRLIFVYAAILYLALGNYSDLKSDSQPSINHTKPNRQYCRNDTTFISKNLQTPLLFAHRGGVLEMPESTKRAFFYSLNIAKADVLEIDVQLTKDAKIVVWHGPELCNVFIEGPNQFSQESTWGKKEIYEYNWSELDGKAWVADPGATTFEHILKDKSGRELLLLSEFLDIFKTTPLNIELKKESFKKNLGSLNGLSGNISEFVRILDAGKYDRNIIVASVSHAIITEFRKQSNERYVTNLSWVEWPQLYITSPNLHNRVLETVYVEFFSSQFLINKVRRLGGSTYVFLTEFWLIPSIDVTPDNSKLVKILDRGVDGIMTDNPSKVREIINTWKQMRCSDL